MNSHQGLTFIEVFIVLSILTIIFSISFSHFKNFYARNQSELFRLQLLHLIEFAHQEALTQQKPVILCKSKNHISCSGLWSEGQLIFIDENANGKLENKNNVLLVTHTSSQGVLKWRSFPFYHDYLSFYANGLSDNGTFWFCLTDKPLWAIFISKSGKTRTVYPNKNDVIDDSTGQSLKCI